MTSNDHANTERLVFPTRVSRKEKLTWETRNRPALTGVNTSIGASITVFCLYFAGLHTALNLSLGAGVPIPYLLCGIACVLSLYIGAAQMRGISLKESWPLVTYVILAVMVTAVAAESDYVTRSAKGILQLFYSLTVAICLYFLVLSIPRDRMTSLCLILLTIMAVASVLESVPLLREYFDSVGEWLSPDWFSSNDLRDELIHGATRAKILSPEPSVAATSFFWVSMLFSWCWRPNLKQGLWWGATAMILLFTVRSPIVIIGIALSVIAIYWFRMANQKARSSLGTNIALLVLLVLVAIGVSFVAYNIFEARLESILSGEGSFSMRVSGALQFAADYAIRHPWFGTGVVGDLEMLSEEIVGFYRSIGMGSGFDISTYGGWVTARKGLSNDIALHFVYFGGIGGLVAGGLLLRVLKLSNRWLWTMLVFQIFTFSMASGGYNSAPIWCIGASLLAAAKLKEVSLEGGTAVPLQT